MVINTVLQKEYLRDYILILIPFLKEEVERLVLYIDDKNDDVKLTNLGKNLNTTVLEYEYNSRKICASQMKRTHNFFSAAHFAMPLPTVNCQLSTGFTPFPPKRKTQKLAYLTLAQDITVAT